MQQPVFRVFVSALCNFPRPRIPLLAGFGKVSFHTPRSGRFVAVSEGREPNFYSRGRYALYDAYRLSGVGPAGSLLAPAYHCRTMLDPAVRLGGQIILYPLSGSLLPDLAAIERLVDVSEQPVKALLLTHYFGFPQPVEAVAEFCAARGIDLIEDCSHAFFRPAGRSTLGKVGKFVVASPYKFVPAEDGGLLLAAADIRCALEALRKRGITEELRSLLRIFQKGIDAAKSAYTMAAMDREVDSALATDFSCGSECDQPGNTLSSMYDPAGESRAGLRVSQWIMRVSHADTIAEMRRSNFRRWLDAIKDIPHCRPLFSHLPDDVVPYMFPLYIDHPDSHFYALKQMGLPIWRWDEMAVSNCAVAMNYRLHLLHLPCHQGIGKLEIEWLTTVLARIMTKVPAFR